MGNSRTIRVLCAAHRTGNPLALILPTDASHETMLKTVFSTQNLQHMFK